jgi:DNA-binding NtrC family response regulator
VKAVNEKNGFALVRKPSSAIEKAAPGAKQILSGMVADTLSLGIRKNPPRFIVVDDEPLFLDLYETIIQNRFKDAIVLKFAAGEPAWLEMLRTTPDFLITDLERQSKMNGWEMIPLLAERKVKCPILLLSGSTKGNELHQKVTLALNGKDEVLLGKIQSGEFKDEDLQDPVAWQTKSDAVQNLIQRVSPTLNIAFLAKPFDTEKFIKILETGLKIHLHP